VIRVLEGEGYLILFVIVALGLPMAVWSMGEEWVKEGGQKGALVLIAAGLAFVIGVIIFAKIFSFVES